MAEACSTSFATNLVEKLVEYLIAPIGRQFEYVLCYKSYVEDLNVGIKELEYAREKVQHSVNEAKYDGKLILTEIQNWLKSVEDKGKEAVNLLNHSESVNNVCFRGWLPNPIVRHPIGRKVKKMTQVIQRLKEKSANSNFQKVYYEKDPTGLVPATSFAATSVDNIEDVLESRAKITEDVIRAIANDNVYVIGVCGPGGVGKSKLLEDIKRRVKEKKLFDVVVMANVSRNPDLKRIQGEIADSLGLKLMNVETVRGRADRLCERLEGDPTKNVLIILDNLWQKLDLKEVGIPCRDDNKVKGCKLLLSSRYLDVLRTDMGSNQEFQVEELKYGEARRLFEKTIGERVNDLEFQSLVDRVVKNCGGLPLLILSVAKRLKHGDLAEWRNALTNMDLSDAKSIVELNYHDLKDERIRSLFLVCALDSGRISLRDSLVYCMGLGLYKKFSQTIENARDRLIMDLRCLRNSSLLLDSDDMKRFRMHDIFTDVAISIASTEWNALAGRKDFGLKEWSKDELEKCTVISFPCVGIDELPEKLDCPNLKMLMIVENNPSLKIPESFFESMEKLQVLDFTSLSFASLPLSIELLVNLKSLCLDYCLLEDVTALGKLKGLQFLSFFKSTIARLPIEIGALTDLRFLDLTGCTRLKVIEPGVLGSFVNLEELYMEDSFDQWEAKNEAPQSNANLAELKSMKKLSTLNIAIPNSANLSRDLPFGKLKNYKIHIGDVWDWSGEYKESRILKLKLDSHNLLLAEWVQRCLQLTRDLHCDGLQDGNDSIHDLCVDGFEGLKNLHVQNSPSFHYVVHSMNNVRCTAFTRLESLILENLNNLEKICHGCLSPESFSKLKTVKMDNCGEIKHLFPLSMMRIFLQLEEIEISKCCLMQQVVIEADEDRDQIQDSRVQSCNLRRLTLRNLLEITSFYKTVDYSVVLFNGQQVLLPLLESLTLSELPKLREIWNSQFLSDVSNLKFLIVEACTFLSSIIPSNLLIKLQNLEAITIERCQSIREVFDLERLIASGDVKILSQLTQLTLSHLPSLGRIWNGNPRSEFCFQNLRALRVQNCEKLRFVFSSSMAKALRQIKEIEISSCELMEEIIDVQEEESKEATTTNTLEFPLLNSLSLKELPNLKTFCNGKYCIHFPSLTRLKISGCPKMMTFSLLEGRQPSRTTDTGLQQACGLINSGLSMPVFFNQNVLFPRLEDLTLSSLCGLRRIWHDELPEKSFGRLASITVGDCEYLSHIFPSTLIERFHGLKKIEVVKCTSLEALMEHVDVNKSQKSLVLVDLEEVKLWHLPRLNALITSSKKAALGLPSLIKVSLSCCHSLRFLFTIDTARTLDKLEVLDVSGCNNMHEVVAVEEGEEQKFKAIKFSHLRTLKLCSLKSLISFSSGSCAYRFPSLRNLSILECTELKAFILRPQASNVERMNEGVASVDEGSYSLFDEKVIFPKLEELRLIGIQSREIWENEMPDESICHLKFLEVKQCHNLSNVISSFTWKRLLHYMESLIVESCNLIEGIYTLKGHGVKEREAARSSPLRKLSLCDLPNLVDIWKNEDLLNLCFYNLTSVKVDNCPRLRNLFTMFMAKSLGQLQHLHLAGCEEMEYIVAREKGQPEEVADRIIIPQLITLCLHNMPKLRSFCHGKHILEWPSLKGFTIEDCKAVEVILGHANCRKLEGNVPTQQPLLLVEKIEFLGMESMKISNMENMKKIWVDELAPNAFCKLKMLIVEDCEKLLSIFSSDIILARFRNLEELTVTNCGSLEVVFQGQESSSSEAHSTSSFQLRKLELERLPKMKYIWSPHPHETLTFGHLRCLTILLCPCLKSLFPISVAKSMTRFEDLSVYVCGVEEIIAEEEGDVGISEGDFFFPQLTTLRLNFLWELRSFYKNSHTSTWPLLKELQVKHCDKIRSFSFAVEIQNCQGSATSEYQPALFSFEKVIPQLEKLTLVKEDVAMISHYIFGNLKELELGCYHGENVAFPSNFLLHGFPNIEKLLVGCSSFEEIFPEDAFGLIDMEKPLKSLGNLKQLSLMGLCNLSRVWKEGSLMAEILKQIEDLFILECPSLSIIFPSPTFQSLAKLDVLSCTGLVHMGTCLAVTSLVHLTKLLLRNCNAMEDVVIDDGNEVGEISFPKLEELILDGLPSLKSFSPMNCAFVFPSLECVIVKRCPKMNIFCKGALRTPKLHKVILHDQDDEGRWEGDLNTTIQTSLTWNEPHQIQ